MPDIDSVLSLTELGRTAICVCVVDIVSLKAEYVQSCFSPLTW
jgi:hypothetical protein